MNRYKTIWTSVLCLGVITTSAGIAQQIGARHPNLAAAQHATEEAYQDIIRAQQANEYDLGGHAAHARDLLSQANAELRASAAAANRR